MLLKTWTRKVSIVEASQSIQLMQGTEEEESGEEGHEGHNHSHELDPHVWLDPVLAQRSNSDSGCAYQKYPEKKPYLKKIPLLIWKN